MAQHAFVLTRRVGRAPGPAERALPGLADGDYSGLTFRGPFERRSIVGPWGSGPPERFAAAALQTGRRQPELVTVELAAWTRDSVELRLRPDVRRPERWRGRRQLRYFDHAHEAIGDLAHALERVVPAEPAYRPARRTA